jgi:hypothetical protein
MTARPRHEAEPSYHRRMAIQRMDDVGIVVDDLAEAIEFFAELGLELQGEATGGGRLVDRIVGWTASRRTSRS